MAPADAEFTVAAGSVADSFLALLKSRGVDYLFANAGTDFPSIVEGLARAGVNGSAVPVPVTAPHENAAVGMAHGYALITGRAQAVMVHVNVGTANAVAGLINAAGENVPLLLAAGRNPISESGRPGTRSWFIHWPQEVFDQAAMVRDYVKWQYELRHESDLETVVDRALQIAHSDPMGPVYLTLPREVLAEERGDAVFSAETRLAPAAPAAPDPEALQTCAAWLAVAERPVILTNTLGRNPESVAALESLAGRFAIPVAQPNPRYMNLPAGHSMHLGYDGNRFIENADLVVLADCDVPWVPSLTRGPGPDCRIVQIGPDPVYGRLPIRGFKSDLAIQADAGRALLGLEAALIESARIEGAAIEARRRRMAPERDEIWSAYAEESESETGSGGALSPAWVTGKLWEACGAEATYISEYPMRAQWLPLDRPAAFFAVPPAGALGWGLGAALGIKLALGDKLVVAGVGDGAYMFNNPAVMHQISAAYDLPILTVVFNNRRWNAVRNATLQMYPDGEAARLNEGMPLAELTPSPDFELYAQASGGFAARVETPDQFAPALEQALHSVRHDRRQALLNVMT